MSVQQVDVRVRVRAYSVTARATTTDACGFVEQHPAIFMVATDDGRIPAAVHEAVDSALRLAGLAGSPEGVP